MMDYSKIADFIIKTVQEESILSGFQYTIDYSHLEGIFDIKLTEDTIQQIKLELEKREEVSDVICDEDVFDVVIYIDFAPNYIEEEDIV